MKTVCYGIFLAFYILPIAHAHSGESVSEIDIGYDSHYISEGRNNLTDGGIVWTTLSHALRDEFMFIAAYGLATHDNADYDELNLTLAYQQEFANLAYILSYTRLAFFKDGQFDNELALSTHVNGLSVVTPTLDLVYSTQANGYFAEFGLQTEFAITPEIYFIPYVKVAFDYGYADRANDGHNHSTLGGAMDISLGKTQSMQLIAEHAIGGSFIARQANTERQQSWLGVHIISRF